MSRMQIYGHSLLKYSLFVPCLMAIALGMYAGGSIKYISQQKEEAALVGILISDGITLRQLSEVNI